MAERRKLIVVSNRGPISYARERGGRIAKRGAGGLVTALASLVSHHDVTWIASAISDEDRIAAASGAVDETARDGSRYRLRLVAHAPTVYDRYYNVIANPVLWFVQHGLWERKHDPGRDFGPAWDDGYVPVNRDFADAVVEELEREAGAAVLFHDYHLYIAPALVRERRPEVALAHFTHIPWVGPDGWSVLPERMVRAIHEGLLACDVAGFHTQRWRRAFLEACSGLGLEPDERRVTAHPISIDPAEFEALAVSEPVLARERELEVARPERLILRVDRTDPSKNVPRGLEAFGLLLKRRPDLRGKVGMLALLDASRQTIPEYVEERERIEAAAAEMSNGSTGTTQSPSSSNAPALTDKTTTPTRWFTTGASFATRLSPSMTAFTSRTSNCLYAAIDAGKSSAIRSVSAPGNRASTAAAAASIRRRSSTYSGIS